MAKPVTYIDDNKIMIRTQWCKGCGICSALCSNKVLVLDTRGKAVVANPSACTACGKCESRCPELAITVNRKAGRRKHPATEPVLPA